MPRMKQSRKMYGCKLCKTLYTELHKVSSGNLRPTNISIELHIERDHPGAQLQSVIDHITKFSKVSEARTALSTEGYEALLGPRAKTEEPGTPSDTSDNSSNVATPTRSKLNSSKQDKGYTPKSSLSGSPSPRKSLIVVLKVSRSTLPSPPASVSKPSQQSSSNPSSSPLPISSDSTHTVPNKHKPKQSSKAKKNQDWSEVLDRSGKPCRKWVKKSVQVQSFTNYTFDLPAWQKKDAIISPSHAQPANIVVEDVLEKSKFAVTAAGKLQSEVDSDRSSLQQENFLVDTSPTTKNKEIALNRSKVIPKILRDSNTKEIHRPFQSLKRSVPEEVDERSTKKSKGVD